MQVLREHTIMLIRLFSLILLVVLPFQVKADDLDMHRQSAFLFAKREDWNNAILHAKATGSDVLVKYFTWQYLKDPESDASFGAINQFIEQNPGWPDQGALVRRAEVALMSANPSDTELNDWFTKHPPQTEQTKIRNIKNPDELNRMIRDAWVNSNYDKNTEARIIEKYHSILRSVDHNRRIDRLLWEDQIADAKRLLKYVPDEYQRLFQARIALVEDKDSAPSAVARVPKALRYNPGLIYQRIKWRARDNDREGVRELLLSVPAEVPYPEKWWTLRDRQIREALSEGNTKIAERLLSKNGQKPGTVQYKEAEWLTGWILLEYRNSPAKAYKVFSKLMEQTETASGKARVAYWLGRTSEKIPKSNPARWYGEASHYATTFYGQLAEWELEKDDKNRHSHSIKSTALPTVVERENFKRQELVRLVYELANAKVDDQVSRFINYIVQEAKTNSDAILAIELGKDVDRIDLSVRAAKKALQRDIIDLEYGWPVVETPANPQIEKPLLLALSRQESEFYTDAVSPSGARGVMQLLPSTAKEIAHKSGLSYDGDKLFETSYNMMLGSIYMNHLILRADGSYLLAIAGYNAGPGRVRQWVGEFGRPGNNVHDSVNWIEKIPTSETRNYVQHVIENMEVYRYLLSDRKTMISDDLVRGG